MSDQDRQPTSSQQNLTNAQTEVDPKRRGVLQAIGASGIAGALMGTASADSDGGLTVQTHSTGAPENQEIPISTQFYSYRNTDLSVSELIQEAAEAGYDAFEPYTVGPGDDPDPILGAMDDTGLEMSSAHISIDSVENNPDGMGQTFSQFGEPLLIEPGAGPDWGDENAVIDFAERCNSAADQLSDHGLEFAHHNHDAEFTEIGDTTGYDIFAENLDSAYIQLDVGWAFVGGRDPIRFITDHPDQIRSIHMKNMTAGGDFTDIHEGDVNMRAVATAARNAGDDVTTRHLVFEHDEPDDPLDSMETGAEWLEKLNQPWKPGGICAIPGPYVHPAKIYTPDGV
jgi:sugar phosphate isomerase/epimerase